MPAITAEEHYARELAIGSEYARQPHANLRAAGCCPSVTIVDHGLPTQHVVYCEEHVAPGFSHTSPHIGLAGVEVSGWRSAPVPWQWMDEYL
jgi:hypothetical protein